MDVETHFCNFEYQLVGASPIIIKNPEVDFFESESPA
jgi:hypothetical protein